jgi:hypothetical protein
MPLDGVISVSPSWNHAAEEGTHALKGTAKWAFNDPEIQSTISNEWLAMDIAVIPGRLLGSSQ